VNKRSLSQRTRPSYGNNKYRGVTRYERTNRWQASIKLGKKNKHLGYFKEELDGLGAVNKAYTKYFPDNPELQQVEQKEKLLDLNSVICNRW